MLSSLITPDEPMVFAENISKCTQSMSLTELTAIVEKYLEKNKLEKNEGLAGIVMIALSEACVE